MNKSFSNLPPILLHALGFYTNATNDESKIHRLLDVFELSVRFLCSISLAGVREDKNGEIFRVLKGPLSRQLARPSLGQWIAIFRDSCNADPLELGLAKFQKDILKKYSEGESPQNLVSLRNDIAHRSRLRDGKSARDILSELEPRLCSFLKELNNLLSGSKISHENDIAVLKKGEKQLDLSPLHVYRTILRRKGKSQESLGGPEYLLYAALQKRWAELTAPISEPISQDSEVAKMIRETFGTNSGDPLTAIFVGREESMARLEEWAKTGQWENNLQTRLFLTGKSGVGKSAVAANLALCLESEQNLRVFHWAFRKGIPRRCVDFMRSFLNREGGSPSEIKDEFWDKVQKMATQPSARATEPVIFILDGLDEALANSDPLACELAFEREIPNVLWLLSGQESVKDTFPPEKMPVVHELDKLTREDMRAIILQDPYSKYRLLEMPAEKQDSIIELISTKSAGNPRYLNLLLEELRRETRAWEDISSESLPQELTEQLHAYSQTLGIVGGSQANKALVAVLTWAKESLSARQIAVFSLDEFAPRKETLNTWTSAIDSATEACIALLDEDYFDESEPKYRFDHDSYRSFYAREIPDKTLLQEISNCQMAIADQASDWKTADESIREYLLRFGVTHLVESTKWDALHTLLTDLEYIRKRCEVGQNEVYNLIKDYNAVRIVSPVTQSAPRSVTSKCTTFGGKLTSD